MCSFSIVGPSLASLGVFDVAVPEDANQSAQESASDELDLSGIDDSELDNEYIRTPEEVEAQAEIWMALNGEYMVELEGINLSFCYCFTFIPFSLF